MLLFFVLNEVDFGVSAKKLPALVSVGGQSVPCSCEAETGGLFVNLGNVERAGFPVGAVGEGQSPAR